ncbi:oxygenase MpaB family protein [Agromyces salentinus]|uniref:Oxygenase MpaB family protein n=1 Tax=Agromyces salentinus TaxID=269421 RepID=A0ABN2MYA5_9MICO|nr:oxygenase MpaB family protein [Agromyces salentinus]
MADLDERAVFRAHAAEGVLLLGGGAAILLQLADARVAHGVARHSDFAERPFDRLFGTLDYVYAIGFGDADIADEAVRRVNARHVPVRGMLDAPASTPASSDRVQEAADDAVRYSAFDADAQRWVASTLLAVALEVHERVWGPLDAVRADAIVRGYAPLGFSLQGARQGWPTTRAEFDAWWEARLATLRVGEQARSVARTLLGASSALPPGVGLLLPPVRLMTAALLPPAIRDAFGFRWTPRAARAAEAWLGGVAWLWPRLPRRVRDAPMRHSLRRARRRYAERERQGR